MAEAGAKYVVLTGSVVGIFGTRGLIKALAGGAELDDPAEGYAVSVPCINVHSPVTEVFVALEKYNVRAVPICEGDKPVGIVEARELVNEALGMKSVLRKKVALRFRVENIASKKLITITPRKVNRRRGPHG